MHASAPRDILYFPSPELPAPTTLAGDRRLDHPQVQPDPMDPATASAMDHVESTKATNARLAHGAWAMHHLGLVLGSNR
ncbi:hypothetical protein F511_42565 [Dorcoceras hygrometricum]|uniref:Uncharacterized protein n=1 Tax=Dorcoceras hygrometricum TaxID=472368 RepID=A0A2Z7BD06_9LAMI|nr:hypothetical protein F511_42565 [Dorcoceras hygrometricum]